MPEGLLHLFSARPIGEVVRDLFDIIIVAYIVYRTLLVLRGTRAMQMGIGLVIVALVYAAAKYLKLVTLVNLLSWLLSSIILIVVVIFQNDIRRALIRMGGKQWFSGAREQQSRVIDEVVAAATELARHRMGALIAFEQDANVLEFVKSEGIALESVVTRELLVSLFIPESVNKLHDGAVLIRDLKIARAGIFFPMPETKILDASLGSRHRAALGITEETDAVVVVVSEERGTISFCFSGNIVSNLDGQSLRHALLGLFGRSARKKRFAKKVAPGGRATTIPAPTSTARPSVSMPSSLPSGAIPTPPPGPATSVKPPIASPVATPLATKATTTPMKPSEPMKPTSEPMKPGEPGPKSESAPKAGVDAGERLSTDRGRPAQTDLPPASSATPTSGAAATSTPVPKSGSFVPTPPSGTPVSSSDRERAERRGGDES
jgi:uncharacterized protein (TIGR00159 family)